MKEGYYLISTPKELRSLVYVYDHEDFEGIKHVSFGHQDGASLIPMDDIRKDSTFTPVSISLAMEAMTTQDLEEL